MKTKSAYACPKKEQTPTCARFLVVRKKQKQKEPWYAYASRELYKECQKRVF